MDLPVSDSEDGGGGGGGGGGDGGADMSERVGGGGEKKHDADAVCCRVVGCCEKSVACLARRYGYTASFPRSI
jgi:hypothetical protein